MIKHFSLVLLSSVAIVVALSVLFLVRSRPVTSPPPPNCAYATPRQCEFGKPCPTFVHCPTPTSANQQEWQTYTNPKFEFSLKYPGNWTSQTTSPSFTRLIGGNLSLMIADSSSEFMNECMKETRNELVTLEKVNFLKRYFQEITFGQMCDNPNPQNRQIWLLPQDSRFGFGMIFFYKQGNQIQSEMLFNQILSTFKFLDQSTNPISELKPSNSKWTGLGVSFDYPATWVLSKPVTTVQKPQPGGFYQQSIIDSSHNTSLLLSVRPRSKNSDGTLKSLDHETNFPNTTFTILAGQSATKSDYSESNVHFFNSTIFLNNSTLVSLHVIVQPADQPAVAAARASFNQILSTLKFTN